MSYGELLIQKEWYNKCRDILQRDQYHCKYCGCLGYHDNSYYECDTAEELDRVFEGILIKDESPSVFINKISEYTLHDFDIYQKENEEPTNQQYIGDKILYKLSISRDILNEPLFAILTASKSRIKDTKCKGNYLWRYKNMVKLLPKINLQYDKGCYFCFENSYFDKYTIRIEKIWPTDGCDDGTGHPIMWGSIVISIFYQNCGVTLYFFDETADKEKNPKVLNIHHKYYVKGKAPWEYDNDALITLCQDCHKLEHETKKTPVYRDLHFNDISGYAQICDRCGGGGYLPQYRHVEDGICFKCYGEGVFVE